MAWSWRLPLRILGRAVTNFIEDRGTHMAAAISYYALFSLFPLTLLAVSIFGIVLRAPGIQDRVLNAIITFLPIEDQSIANSLRSVADLGPTLTVISLLGSIWSAGALSAAVRSALNVAFEVDRDRPLLRAKMIDYMLLPIIGLPLLGGIVLSTAWRLAQEEFASRFGFVDSPLRFVWGTGAVAIPFGLSFVAFLLIYWLLPARRVLFRHIWPGALLAAGAFETLKGGFTYYLDHFANFDVIYGSLGSVIVLLFWIYLSANIMIFGGEVADEVQHVLHEEPRHGHGGQGEGEGDWRRSALSMLRGLVLAGPETFEGTTPPAAAHPGDERGPAARSPRGD